MFKNVVIPRSSNFRPERRFFFGVVFAEEFFVNNCCIQIGKSSVLRTPVLRSAVPIHRINKYLEASRVLRSIFGKNLLFRLQQVFIGLSKNVEFVCRIISVKVSVETFPTGVFLIASERC